MIFNYWKQVLAIGGIFAFIFVIHHSGYTSGKKEVQITWDAQKLVDAQVAAKAAAKTATIVVKSATGTQDANSLFKKNIAKYKDHYNSNNLPSIVYSAGVLDASVRKANSSTMSDVSVIAEQPNATSADTVSRTEFNQLANDCLATTLQLNNAQDWAADQDKIYAQ